jgi:hypothetical protein
MRLLRLGWNTAGHFRLAGLFLLHVLLIVISLECTAQMLNNKLGEAFTDQPFFNEDIIRRNGIQSISGRFTTKKVGDVMRNTDLERKYYFDRQGKLIKMHETVQAPSGKDTVVTYWEYDSRGNVTVIRKADQYGFYATHFDYDDKNRVIREEFRRNLNQNKNRIGFQLGEEFVVSYETSRYENYDRQEKRIFINSYDYPYKEEITYFDEEGIIIERMDRLKRTSGIKQTRYTYNEKGLLDSLIISSNQTGLQERVYTYEYDNYGNILSKQYYNNGTHQTDYQIIYHRETSLVNYILTREVITNFITVLKLSNYTFFEKEEQRFE